MLDGLAQVPGLAGPTTHCARVRAACKNCDCRHAKPKRKQGAPALAETRAPCDSAEQLFVKGSAARRASLAGTTCIKEAGWESGRAAMMLAGQARACPTAGGQRQLKGRPPPAARGSHSRGWGTHVVLARDWHSVG